MLQHITLPSGDAALVVNNVIVLAADPCCGEDPSTVESAAENLALALGEPLMRLSLDQPHDEAWTWEDIVAESTSLPRPPGLRTAAA